MEIIVFFKMEWGNGFLVSGTDKDAVISFKSCSKRMYVRTSREVKVFQYIAFGTSIH